MKKFNSKLYRIWENKLVGEKFLFLCNHFTSSKNAARLNPMLLVE